MASSLDGTSSRYRLVSVHSSEWFSLVPITTASTVSQMSITSLAQTGWSYNDSSFCRTLYWAPERVPSFRLTWPPRYLAQGPVEDVALGAVLLLGIHDGQVRMESGVPVHSSAASGVSAKVSGRAAAMTPTRASLSRPF